MHTIIQQLFFRQFMSKSSQTLLPQLLSLLIYSTCKAHRWRQKSAQVTQCPKMLCVGTPWAGLQVTLSNVTPALPSHANGRRNLQCHNAGL